jgi:hypothetical protein
MAHYAELDENNIVLRVLVVSNEFIDDEDGQNHLANICNLGGVWKKTSYNTSGGVHLLDGVPFRKNYAGIGYFYDEVKDAFIPPKPFASWTLNTATCLWESPIPYPNDNKGYDWNETTQEWIEIL